LKFRSLSGDTHADFYGIVVWLMILGITAFIWLVMNTFLEYFFNIMDASYTRDFFSLIWVQGGIFIVIFLVSSFSLLMYMQKSKNPFGGTYR